MKQFKLQDKKKHNYFEGYYTRVVDERQDINYAFIFAKTLYKKDPHAFIQIFDGTSNTYLRFPLEAFDYSESHTVTIGDNTLSPQHLTVKNKTFIIDVTFHHQTSLESKSAMGYLSHFPLQCYQEVLYMSMDVIGTLIDGNTSVSLKAYGYMEKTYGRRFPKRWFWLQAAHFQRDTYLSMAGGSVPTLVVKPFGFFTVFMHKGTTYRFGTYNLSRIKIVRLEENKTQFIVRKKTYKLVIDATMHHPVELLGPSDYGAMNLPVYESLSSTVHLRFYINKILVYEGKSSYAGYENMLK